MSYDRIGYFHHKHRKMIKEFAPWMVHAVREHVNQGYSYGSFGGRYCISQVLWNRWSKEVAELVEIRLRYNKRSRVVMRAGNGR